MTHSRQVDVSRLQVQIHQVKCDSTLQVPLNLVDGHLSTDIENPTVAQIRFRDGLVDRLVGGDPFPEIRLGFGFGHVLVIGITRLDFQSDIRGDDCWVIAERFEE